MSTTPSTPSDTRTYNQRMLDQVRALLLGKALDDVALYKLGERELTKIPVGELRAWEAELEARVRRDLRRRKGLPQRSMPVVFGGR